MGPPCGIDPMPHRTMSKRFTSELCPTPGNKENTIIIIIIRIIIIIIMF